MRIILVASRGILHPPLLGRRELLDSLQEMKDCAFETISSLEKLPAQLGIFSAIVIYLHHKTLSNPALAALEQYVSEGGGLLGIHSATASYKQQPRYFDILGGRFIGHGPIAKYEVRQTSAAIFSALEAFTLYDELYLHELQPGIEIHFSAAHQGQEIPVVWTKRFGKGRVCYASPGHTVASMRRNQIQSILRQGLRWVMA